MGNASSVSEPILFAVTASRLFPFLLLLACVALMLLVVRLSGLGTASKGAPRRLLRPATVALACFSLAALWSAVQLASPAVLLKATERGMTSYLTGEYPSAGVRLQLARHADSGGLFVPWRAMEAISVERVDYYQGTSVVNVDVLVITLRPGFENLRLAGVVVVPGGRRSTLDLPLPRERERSEVLSALTVLRQRFAGN